LFKIVGVPFGCQSEIKRGELHGAVLLYPGESVGAGRLHRKEHGIGKNNSAFIKQKAWKLQYKSLPGYIFNTVGRF
jgi:hypothetical protein